MTRLLTGLATAAALALSAASAQAACDGHNVTASSEKPQESVAISTYDGAAAPVTTEETKDAVVAETVCAEGDVDCDAATK
jgi:hypothetical protein